MFQDNLVHGSGQIAGVMDIQLSTFPSLIRAFTVARCVMAKGRQLGVQRKETKVLRIFFLPLEEFRCEFIYGAR